MILETQRLTLREMTQDDYADLCKILQDKEVMYAYEPVSYTHLAHILKPPHHIRQGGVQIRPAHQLQGKRGVAPAGHPFRRHHQTLGLSQFIGQGKNSVLLILPGTSRTEISQVIM